MAAQCLENIQRGHVAQPRPNGLWRRPVQKGELARELDSERTAKVPGQVLVEQQPHAGVASRRSRIAANSIAARTCSAVNSGKSATISSMVMPDAR